MNQWATYNFALQKENRLYVFQLLPGAPWEEVYGVLDEFRANFQALQADAKRLEEEKNKAAEAPLVEAEVVNAPPANS